MNSFVDKIISGHDLTFNVKFQRDEESGWYAVHVVEFPGCVSQGETIAEAKANIANALELYMEELLAAAIRHEAGRETPPPGESTVSETAKMLVRPRFEVHV